MAGADEPDLSAKEAGEKLRDLMLNDYAGGGMSAYSLCTMSHYITLAGAVGVEDLALRPQSTGNAQKYLDKILGFGGVEDTNYMMEVPGHCKYQQERTAANNSLLSAP